MHDYLTNWTKLVILLALVTIGVGVATFVPRTAVVAAGACSTSGLTSGAYTITICITSPASGATLTAPATVNASTTLTVSPSYTGTVPFIQRVIYTLDNNYLLSSFSSPPWAFTLPIGFFANGSHTLAAQVALSDGFTSTSASIGLTFKNSVTPTPTTAFTPAPGTSPQSGQPLTIAVGGDGAGGETTESDVTKLIAGWNPNLMLYLGDVYQEGTDSEFFNWYSPSTFFGRFRTITDPTIGNHEYLTGSANGYFDYWNNPPNYYSFNAGGWHFISLNSNCSSAGGCGAGSPQYAWLQSDLTANAKKCTIAFWHAPLYDVGPEATAGTVMNGIWSLLAQNRAVAVLNGHDHNYQRWTPLDGSGNPSSTGVAEFVVGSSGHAIQQFVTTDSRLVFGSDAVPTTYGALRLQLSGGQLAFSYLNTAGATLDSGTLSCPFLPAPVPTGTATPTATPGSAPHPGPSIYLPMIIK